MEKESSLKQREERIVSGEVQAVPSSSSDDLELELARIRAHNEDLRKQVDFLTMGGGGGGASGGGSGSELANLHALQKKLHEIEAQRVLERSEAESRLKREVLAREEEQAAHEHTAAQLLSMTQAHEHASALLASLQAQHDEAVSARSSTHAVASGAADGVYRPCRL